MSVHWHRVCFEPVIQSNRFANAKAFSAWCANHLTDIDYQTAGHIIKPAHEAVGYGGSPFWNILIRGKPEYLDGEVDIIQFLSDRHWMIDGQYVHLYIRHGAGDEILFPIRGGRNICISMAEKIALLRAAYNEELLKDEKSRAVLVLESILRDLHLRSN